MLQSLRTRFAPDQVMTAPVLQAAPPKQGLVLFEEILRGTHYAALNTAVIASGFNALSARRRFQRAAILRNHTPHPPSARGAWPGLMLEMRQPEALAGPVQAYLDHLPEVGKAIEFICAEIATHGQAAAVQQHAPRLARASRQMSDLGVLALNALDRIANAVLAPYYTRNTVLLRGLLSDAALGESPLIDRDGHIFVPELPRKRALPARRISTSCVIEHKAKDYRAIAVTLTAGGVNVENAPPLAAKSVVVVEIENRCMAGVVVWARGAYAGIKFDQPLKEDDPLISAGSM